MNADEFIRLTCERPLPKSALEKVKVFARELAEGALHEIWSPYLARLDTQSYGSVQEYDMEKSDFLMQMDLEVGSNHTTRFIFNEVALVTTEAFPLVKYIAARWKFQNPKFQLLESMGYMKIEPTCLRLEKTAFDLLLAHQPSSIFISYRRKESSAFALLVLARLKAEGLDAFVDLALVPGDDWHADLMNKVQMRDYVVLLLAPTSLESAVVHDEIKKAVETKSTVIPIWHNGFVYDSNYWKPKVPDEVDHLLKGTHAIRVLEESALAYNNAVVEMLNRFGITP